MIFTTRNRLSLVSLILPCILLFSVLATTASATNYYVSPPPLGSDSNSGTEASPWATPWRAAQQVRPGDTVFVNPGTYTTYPGRTEVFKCFTDGTETSRIVFKARNESGPVLLDNTGSYGSTVIVGSYTTVEGFRIKAGKVGVGVGLSLGVVIRECEIFDQSEDGIRIAQSAYSQVLNNTIYHRIPNPPDLGPEHYHALYITGSHPTIEYENHIVRGNVCYDWSGSLIWINPNQANDDSAAGFLVEDNILFGCQYGGISLANVHHSIVQNNVCYGIDLASSGWRGFITLGWLDHSELATHHVQVVNNTCVGDGSWPNGCGVEIVTYCHDNVVLNNVLITPRKQVLDDSGNETNTVLGNYLATYSPSLLSTTFADPGVNDYHLLLAGVVDEIRNRGVDFVVTAEGDTVRAPDVDRDGVPRPPGQVDIGAHEVSYELRTIVDPQGAGTITVTPDRLRFSFDEPEQVEVRAVPNPDHQFTGWLGLPSSTQDPQQLTVTQDRTITAYFDSGELPPGVPEPEVLDVVETSPACAHLSWQGDPESEIVGYKIFYGQQSVSQGQATTYTNSVDVGGVNFYDVCSLAPSRYYFAVTAYNAGGQQSSYSAEVSLYVKGSLGAEAFQVSRWSLDETTGTSAQDSWGSSPGALVNNPTWRSTGGPIGGALEFDGINDYVGLGASDIPDGPGATIAFWFRADDFNQPEARFISKASATTLNNHYWMVGTVNSTGLRFYLRAGGVTTPLETGAGEIEADKWYHIAATYDGQKMQLFRNGTLVKEVVKTGIVDRSPTAQAAIGAQPVTAGGGHAFDGLIDDVRVYGCALTEAEIVSIIALAPNMPPVAKVSASKNSGFAPLEVSFEAAGSIDPENQPLNYSWSFGEGSPASGSTVQYTYNNAGSFEVVLEVTDDGGKTDNESLIITVSESQGPPQPPVWALPDTLYEDPPRCTTLRWQPNTEADLAGYEVYYGPLSVALGHTTAFSETIRVDNQTTIYEVSELALGDCYFALRAFNAAGEFSGYSTERRLYVVGPDVAGPAITPGVPAPGSMDHDPRDVDIWFFVADERSGVDIGSLNVLVDGSPAVGLNVTQDPNSPTRYRVACEPDGTLPANSTVEIRVSVSDLASPPNHAEKSWTFDTGAVPPVAPMGLHSVQAEPGCISVAWLANTEPDLKEYIVYFDTSSVWNGEATEYSDSATAGLALSRTISNLDGGTYAVALRAKNESGQYSAFSGEISVEVIPEASTGVEVPRGVEMEEDPPGCVTVSWMENSNPDVVGYVVHWDRESVENGDAAAYGDSVEVRGSTSYSRCGFSAGPLYAAVRAFNTAGVYSEYSREESREIVGEDHELPVVSGEIPGSGAVDIPQDTDIRFIVSDNLSGVDINTLDVRINGALPGSVVYNGGPSRYVVTCEPAGRLPEFAEVTVRVSVSDLAPERNTAEKQWKFWTGTSRPQAPAGVTASGTETGCAIVRWDANPELDVVRYWIYWGSSPRVGDDGSVYDDSTFVALSTIHPVCGLLEGTWYFALRAENSDGYKSDLSEEVFATVTSAPSEEITPPQRVQVSESKTEPGRVLLKWLANSEPDVTGYTVYHRRISEGSGGTSDYVSVDVGNVTEKEIPGFLQGTYAFAVKAYNAAGQYSAFSTEKRLDVIGPDLSAPMLIVGGPLHGDVDVPQNTPLFFVIADDQSGIDPGSVSVLINGSPPERVSMTRDGEQYAVVCELGGALPRNTIVRVEVTVSDLATPPNTTTYRWSFSTGTTADTSPPVFFEFTPHNGAKGVSRNAAVRVGVRDKSGVDTGSISLLVNGSLASGVTINEQTNGDVFIEYTKPDGFDPLSTVEIRVQVDDIAANRADTTFSFETSEMAAEPAPVVTIMPDGYWVDDPSRPLEVRGIPPGWEVKIFDTSGVEVLAVTNTYDTLWNFEWNFTNQRGHRVAKSLYLIRVLDTGGSVRRSGKFVVQTAGP